MTKLHEVFTLNKVIPRYRTGSTGWVESYEVLGIFSTNEKAHEEMKKVFTKAVLGGHEYMESALNLSKEDAHTLGEWNIGGQICDSLEEMMQIVYLLLPQKIIEVNNTYQKEELELPENEIKCLPEIQQDFDYRGIENEIFEFLVKFHKSYSAIENVFDSIAKIIDMADEDKVKLHKDKVFQLINQVYDKMVGEEIDQVLCVMSYDLDKEIDQLY